MTARLPPMSVSMTQLEPFLTLRVTGVDITAPPLLARTCSSAGTAIAAVPERRIATPTYSKSVTPMARVKPSIRPTETYTEPNFVRVYTAPQSEPRVERLATIEHLSYTPKGDDGRSGWSCSTIVDGEIMSKEDALFIARNYAIEHDVPVIYECHSES
jgi:hypothetical protein